MADGSMSMRVPKHANEDGEEGIPLRRQESLRSTNGMYGKLQQVIQSEKVRDMGYLKSLSAETGFKDERMCISVRILTRALEAKLIVCSCSRVKDGKN
ncbi:hypothetical protein PHJA_001737300 [Phtheirospermum japonicum]|uniref:Uncharacterized protein n=1 Tax=Phtheirospermum japonicum TaxID=374723 RepID=A0A830CCB1_9LAMI|nr:hypothetical protein PHJA_001737300 [Phtheirospermum japonicum]